MRSHASAPTPLVMEDGRCRVYFTSRDDRNRSHVGWFEILLNDPSRTLAVSQKPVLTPGPLGNFDDHGVYASSIARAGECLFLYTIGWNPGIRPPLFYSSIGLALSRDGGVTFEKFGESPILARSNHDPCLVTAPMVLHENGRWQMWYVSGYRWDEGPTGLQSHYNIKYARSDDGISWQRDGQLCIGESSPDETNIARCCVLKKGERYDAWYSYCRSGRYRIGYAQSKDGISWVRKDDQIELIGSGQAWEAEAQAYPYVIEYGGHRYMFYNGNQYGRDGIGLAICEKSNVEY